jgi:hypothetical protein
MLTGEKKKALERLVGTDTANQLIKQLSGREKEAQTSGVAYKSMPSADEVADIVNELLGTTEKCSPGTKDGKYKGSMRTRKQEDDMEDDDMESKGYGKMRTRKQEDDMEDDDMEDDDEEMGSLLTDDEMESIAEKVADRMMGRMDEMKAMMDGLDKELKMRGYSRGKSADSDEFTETLKEYTSTQEQFSEAMVNVLEEMNTRLKAMESSIGIGHTPSSAINNIIATKETMTRPRTPEESAYAMWFGNQ